jgi:pantothenate kinase
MYENFPSDRGTGSSWSPVALSFLAGVSSASIIWYTLGKIRRESALSEEKELLASFRQWWLRDIQSRIGELPSLPRRTRWPWDRKNRSGSSHPSTPDKSNTTSSSSSSQSSTSNNDSTGAASPSPVDEKSGLCIGSIFGLDVGGTLAKLVYFEQKAETMDHDRGAGHRERNYRFSASARAVFMARRGAGDEDDSASGTASPRAPPRSRSSTGDDTGQAAWTPSRIRRRSLDTATSPRPLHSNDSDKDLESLNMIRNESLPDDLHAYAEAVGTPNVRAYGAGTVDDGSGTIFREKSENDYDRVATGEDAEIRKSRSMLDFSKSRDHAEALDRFYNFARRLDSYREGVKDHELSFYSRELGGEFHFIRFETRRMQNAMDLIRANNLHLNICEMGATGGGAHKFAAKWEQDLAIQMQKQDELDSLVAGMQFVLSTVVGECYTFRPHDAASARSSSVESSNSSVDESSDNNVGAPMDEEDDDTETNKAVPEDRGKVDEWWWSRKVQRDAISYSSTYPYLLVTIGTGVSILRVDGPRKHERISGSTIGGGTYWGLIRLLTDLEDFEDVMKLAERGDPSKVDMMVGDIYGENSDALEKIGLTSNLVSGRRAQGLVCGNVALRMTLVQNDTCIPCLDEFPRYCYSRLQFL